MGMKPTDYHTSRITYAEAIQEGMTVDTRCYPWFAYKGPRFAPTENHLCWTEIESALFERLESINTSIFAVGAPLGSDNYFYIRHQCSDPLETQ